MNSLCAFFSYRRHKGQALIKRFGLLFLVIQLIIGCHASDVAVVEVDFGSRESPSSMMGFLHGIEDTHRIPDKWLAPLFASPVSWRIRPESDLVTRAQELGVEKPIIVVSDTWNGQAPARDWSAWEEHVRSLAQQFGSDVIYDIVNEPDMPFFWSPQNGHPFPLGWADFHESFRRAHDVIREEIGEHALISGPSFSFLWGSEKRLYDFVQFCHDNRLTVQILSVHVIYQPDIMLPLVAKTLRKYRKDFIEDGRYEGAGIQQIHVNEYGMPDVYARPGSMVSMLRHLELGGADAANRASWAGRVEVVDNSVDGYLKFVLPGATLDPIINGDIMFSDNSPRPVWWIYRYYAAGVSSRVAAVSDSNFYVPIASGQSDSATQAQVIIGAAASALKENAQSVDLRLKNVDELPFVDDENSVVEVQVKLIENNETKPLMFLPIIMNQHETLFNSELRLSLPALEDYESYIVLLRRG